MQVAAGKSLGGHPEWKMSITNQYCHPILVTLANQEAPGCKDFDTHTRDLLVQPGKTATLKLPRDGNGVPDGAEYRITVSKPEGGTLGVEKGVYRAGC